MYDSQILVERIKERANSQGIGMVKLHEMCGISRNVVSQTTSRKKGMTAENLYSIAEVLDCSVDYLLGRSDLPNSSSGISISAENNGIQAVSQNGLAIIDMAKASKDIEELVKLVQDLPLVQRSEAIIYLNNLRKENN